MRLVTAALMLAFAAGAGGYVVYSNPGVVPRAEHAAQQAADWIHGIIEHDPNAGPTQAATASPLAAPATSFPNNTPPPIILVAPSNPATEAPSTPPPTSTPDPGPSATPVAATVVPWSTLDCNWAEQVLNWDQQLDVDEADAVADGSDTRYGTGPDVVAYYQAYAAEWQLIYREVYGVCAPGQNGTLTHAQVDDAILWFTKAITAHQADSNPADASWTVQWVGWYQRLTAMFVQTGLQ